MLQQRNGQALLVISLLSLLNPNTTQCAISTAQLLGQAVAMQSPKDNGRGMHPTPTKSFQTSRTVSVEQFHTSTRLVSPITLAAPWPSTSDPAILIGTTSPTATPTPRSTNSHRLTQHLLSMSQQVQLSQSPHLQQVLQQQTELRTR